MTESSVDVPEKVVVVAPHPGIMTNLNAGVFSSHALFHLSVRARQLRLLNGFQKLLSPPTFKNVDPYAFQTETALRVLRRYEGRALLCDEVGLGKTVEAGIILKEYILRGLVKKALILTPPGLIGQWREELSIKFGVDTVSPDDDAFKERGATAWQKFPFIVASLAMAKRPPQADALLKIRHDLLIVDEAHRLKNRTSVAWTFVNALEKKFLLLLTATPVQNDLEELYNLVTLLRPGQLGSSRDFKNRFVNRDDPRQPKNAEALRDLLSECMVRNTRSQIDRGLPPRRAHTLRPSLSPKERDLYDTATVFLKSCATPPENGGRGGISRPLLKTLLKELVSSPAAFAETAGKLAMQITLSAGVRAGLESLKKTALSVSEFAKVKTLMSLVASMASEKVVVFTAYQRTLGTLATALEQKGITAVVYHGGLTRDQKDEAVRQFQENPSVTVFLSTEAGGEGRNLQFARTLINMDLPYNPMTIEQRVGRIHRIGQTHPVSIYNIAAENTIEDDLLKLLDEKINMFEQVVGEMDMILGTMEEEKDFEDLFLDAWYNAQSPTVWENSVAEMGERLLKAKQDYVNTRALDDALFQKEMEAL